MKTTTNGFLRICASLAAAALLAACQTTGAAQQAAQQASKIDTALERAAGTAASNGAQNASPAYLEKLYKRDPQDEQAALNYARSLRRSDQPERAKTLLEPFANDKASSAAAKREYAAIQLELGDYNAAEKYAQKAVLQDDRDFEAYHYLGIALDAKSMHPEAERAFRKALDLWQGDPVPVMNNLALNLTAQGYLDEASEILHKAKTLAPDRLEIERNLRIVTALQQSESYKAPKPVHKPRPL